MRYYKILKVIFICCIRDPFSLTNFDEKTWWQISLFNSLSQANAVAHDRRNHLESNGELRIKVNKKLNRIST